jgi:hypothetical protein
MSAFVLILVGGGRSECEKLSFFKIFLFIVACEILLFKNLFLFSFGKRIVLKISDYFIIVFIKILLKVFTQTVNI